MTTKTNHAAAAAETPKHPTEEPEATDRHPALAPDDRGDPEAVQNRIDLNDPTF